MKKLILLIVGVLMLTSCEKENLWSELPYQEPIDSSVSYKSIPDSVMFSITTLYWTMDSVSYYTDDSIYFKIDSPDLDEFKWIVDNQDSIHEQILLNTYSSGVEDCTVFIWLGHKKLHISELSYPLLISISRDDLDNDDCCLGFKVDLMTNVQY